ncbi:hypothetical protein Tco_0062068, partial [Tanacetum coccineum]
MKDPSQRAIVENDSTRMRSCMSASEKEQNKHAIAIAATATAAADATVANPQALVAVVRLSSDGSGTLFSGRKNGLPPRFNQYIEVTCWLFLRKRVAATLYSMQALLRAQLAVRSQRAQLAGQPEIRNGKST